MRVTTVCLCRNGCGWTCVRMHLLSIQRYNIDHGGPGIPLLSAFCQTRSDAYLTTSKKIAHQHAISSLDSRQENKNTLRYPYDYRLHIGSSSQDSIKEKLLYIYFFLNNPRELGIKQIGKKKDWYSNGLTVVERFDAQREMACYYSDTVLYGAPPLFPFIFCRGVINDKVWSHLRSRMNLRPCPLEQVKKYESNNTPRQLEGRLPSFL